jgi:predicted negative regulator of RcsB-dependent stress response
MLACAVLLSCAGWAGWDRVQTSQDETARLAAVARAEARDADLAQLPANDGRYLATLIRQQCDAGTQRDVEACEVARKILR